jgi:hypothetical protein
VLRLPGRVLRLRGRVLRLRGRVLRLRGRVLRLRGRVLRLRGRVLRLRGRVLRLRGRVLRLPGGGFPRHSGSSAGAWPLREADGGDLAARRGRVGPAWLRRVVRRLRNSAHMGCSGHGFRYFVRGIPALCQIMRTMVPKIFHKAVIRRNNHAVTGPRRPTTPGAATSASQRAP